MIIFCRGNKDVYFWVGRKESCVYNLEDLGIEESFFIKILLLSIKGYCIVKWDKG